MSHKSIEEELEYEQEELMTEQKMILDPAELTLTGWLEPPQGYYEDLEEETEVAKDTIFVCGSLAMLFSGVAMVYHDTHHGSVTVGTLLATGAALLTIAGGLELWAHRGIASIIHLFGTLLYIVGALYYYPEMRDKFIGNVFFCYWWHSYCYGVL
uniref:Uncharacterized protein n=1 Tax=Aureoumbra lagunensis TaxID=44058 RepID=A0A7S3NNR0_9STRA